MDWVCGGGMFGWKDMDGFDGRIEEVERRKVVIWKKKITKSILSLLLIFIYVFVTNLLYIS